MQFSVFAYLPYRKKTTKEGKTENIDMKKTWGQYIAAAGAGIFLAAAVLKEQITLLKSIGVLIIIAGVILIAGGDEE